MFARNMLLRRLCRSSFTFKPIGVRSFSLLVPLKQDQVVPADLVSTPLTDAHFAKLDAEYSKFNENCAQQL